MKGVKIMVREYVSGAVVERSMFPVGNAAKVRNPRRKGSTPLRKQDQNDRMAVKRLARAINCNFSHGDILITLTYSEERLNKLLKSIPVGNDAPGVPPSPDAIRKAAIHERDCFLRRVKRDLEKQDIKLKYITVTSDIDGETGDPVRIHHHVLLPKEAFDAAFKHWCREEVDYRPLRDQKDYTSVAVYLLRQVRRQPDMKKYSTSRNLDKPVIREKIITAPAELKAPRGAVVMHRDEYDYQTMTQYIRFIKKVNNEQRTVNNERTRL
ncbi:MAG: hypothetical protein FWG36_01985 [Oscillospiraceae bacterium]|nr:hypothetical protein [Oscillospiraceae bacterium]